MLLVEEELAQRSVSVDEALGKSSGKSSKEGRHLNYTAAELLMRKPDKMWGGFSAGEEYGEMLQTCGMIRDLCPRQQ